MQVVHRRFCRACTADSALHQKSLKSWNGLLRASIHRPLQRGPNFNVTPWQSHQLLDQNAWSHWSHAQKPSKESERNALSSMKALAGHGDVSEWLWITCIQEAIIALMRWWPMGILGKWSLCWHKATAGDMNSRGASWTTGARTSWHRGQKEVWSNQSDYRWEVAT